MSEPRRSSGRPAPENGSPRKRARKEIPTGAAAAPAIWQTGPTGERRRLTDEERRAFRERRTAVSGPPPAQEAPAPPVETPQRGSSRLMVVAGTLLICALTLLAFAGGRIFGRVDSPAPTPTPAVAAAGAATPLAAANQAGTDVPAAATPDLGLATGRKTAKGASVPGHPADGVRVVCLDPGHGGPNDRGRQALETSPYYSLEEANLVLQLAWDLQARLQGSGIKVAMTRNSDNAVNPGAFDVNGDGKTAVNVKDPEERKIAGDLDELQSRINVCNMATADLMISMHINGFDTPAPRGYETWFTQERPFGDQSHRLATLVYRALQSQLAKIGYRLPSGEERGVKPDTKVDNQTEHSVFDHFVLTGPAVEGKVDPSRMPATVAETLFVSNDGDAAILGSPDGEQAIVTAYELAILQYFNEYPG